MNVRRVIAPTTVRILWAASSAYAHMDILCTLMATIVKVCFLLLAQVAGGGVLIEFLLVGYILQLNF